MLGIIHRPSVDCQTILFAALDNLGLDTIEQGVDGVAAQFLGIVPRLVQPRHVEDADWDLGVDFFAFNQAVMVKGRYQDLVFQLVLADQVQHSFFDAGIEDDAAFDFNIDVHALKLRQHFFQSGNGLFGEFR